MNTKKLLWILNLQELLFIFLSYFLKLQSFLKQRLNEYHVNETILMTFIMQNAPASIQKINENGKNNFDERK